MATTAKLWHAQFVDDTGAPQAGVKVYHYEAGTTTDKDVYRDPGKTTTDTQPVIGDSAGFVKFYGDGTYRLRIVSSADILLYDIDSIEIAGANTGTSGRVLFYDSSGAITDDATLTYDSVNKRFGVGTSTNITEAVVMKPGGFLAAERTGAGSNEGAKRLIGLNTSNKVSIDPQGQGTVFENLPVSGLLYLDANGQLQVLTLQNGMLPIGSTGAVPVAALPIEGNGVDITAGAGSLTIANDGMAVLDRTVASLQIINTASETTLYSVTIPANKLLNPNKAIKILIAAQYQNDTAANATFTLKIKLGTDTLFNDATANITTNSAIRPMLIECTIHKLASSGQFSVGRLSLGPPSSATNGIGDLGTTANFLDSVFVMSGTADLTESTALTVTITHSSASNSLSVTRMFANAVIV